MLLTRVDLDLSADSSSLEDAALARSVTFSAPARHIQIEAEVAV